MSCIEKKINITELFIAEAEIRSTSKRHFFCGQLVPLIQAKTIGNIKIIPEKTYFSVSSKQLKLEDKMLTMLPALKSDRLKKKWEFFPRELLIAK